MDKGGASTDRRKGSDGPTVLVAEDEPLVRRLAVRVLRGAGFSVIEAEDGKQALETFRETDGAIDLLVTDLVMPGLSGTELADAIQQQTPDLGVLFMSGYHEEASRESLTGPNRIFLAKPWAPSELLDKVRRLL